jgi:HAD superfamily hydrolase (TIGR01662 family)
VTGVDIVVPTVGRPSLARLLEALGQVPAQVVVVDDRRDRSRPLPLADAAPRVMVLAGRGCGPATARNIGWRASSAEWVAFLDDDVVPEPGWFDALGDDLADLADDIGGSQGRLSVPLPDHRRPTDHERDVAGLASAEWATADMVYRRAALAVVGGFDERFPRAYREDADLAARVRSAGWGLVVGDRRATHPVAPAGHWISVRRQAGNADDVLLRVRHGRQWRKVTGVGRGRRPRHLATSSAAAVAVVAAVLGRHRVAGVAAAGWLAGTAELAWARITPGPLTADEVATMALTSVAIPPSATFYWLRGWATLPRRLRSRPSARPAAVLLDRDGTLIRDVPYNGDPSNVMPMPGARRALDRLRAEGIPTAVVSNQSGMARGILRAEQVNAINSRIEELLGPLGPWIICPHAPDDGCECRKPNPGMVLRAAELLRVQPSEVAVIGDIGADIEAAEAAGARGILVPTSATCPGEIAEAAEVAADLAEAIDLLMVSRR